MFWVGIRQVHMKTQFKLQTLLFVGLALIFCAALVRPTRAAPQITIQAMINAAADGASIDIPAGTYTENLIIDSKNITLRGAFTNPPTTTIQPANSSDRIIYANSNKGLRLENLIIKNGNATGSMGGGVYAAGGTLQIVNCHITGNSADYGAGVFLDDWKENVPPSILVVSSSQIDHNSAVLIGGGIYAKGSATLANTTLDSNTAYWNGGGIHVDNGATVLTGGVYSNNHATAGNGGAVNVNNALSITGSQFTGNSAGDVGGAVNQWNTPGIVVTISGATFTSNTAYHKGGGAHIKGSLTLTNTTFTSNTVDSLASKEDVYGGGLYAASSLSVNGATFTGNQTISADLTPFNCGGGLHSAITTGTVTVTNSQFNANQGWFGGGLDASTTLSVTHSSFTNNQGGYGGGINVNTFTGDWLLFQDNTATNYGGGVDASDLTLTHARFIHNSAYKGGAFHVWEILRPSSNLLLVENSASLGAAIHAEANVTATLYNVTIARPAQAAGPAVYLEANATLNLYNSIVNNYTNAIWLNSATLNEDYNLFYNNTYDIVESGTYTVNSGGHTTGTLPPGFVNPAAGNYHLKSSSYAIGHGHNYGLADDLDGRPRLAGRNDIGAYQFWASTYIPLIRR